MLAPKARTRSCSIRSEVASSTGRRGCAPSRRLTTDTTTPSSPSPGGPAPRPRGERIQCTDGSGEDLRKRGTFGRLHRLHRGFHRGRVAHDVARNRPPTPFEFPTVGVVRGWPGGVAANGRDRNLRILYRNVHESPVHSWIPRGNPSASSGADVEYSSHPLF